MFSGQWALNSNQMKQVFQSMGAYFWLRLILSLVWLYKPHGSKLKEKWNLYFSSTGALPAAQQTTFSLNVSAKEFVPSIASCQQLSSKAVGGGSSDTEELGGSADGGGGGSGPEARQCARCCKTYYVDHQGEALSVEKCLYHWGKVRYGSVQSGETDR